MKMRLILLFGLLLAAQNSLSEVKAEEGMTNMTTTVEPDSNENKTFSPVVTATCRAGIMSIKVETKDNFVGVVQSRDYRKPECSGYGENAKVTFLRVNMLADSDKPDYCGVFISDADSGERSVAIAVRIHRTLELVDDKFYMISCGKAGFRNSRNETSSVNLQLLRDGRRVQHVVYGHEYTLRAHFSAPDGKFGMKVKRCFSFSDTNNTVQLVDDRGCPEPTIMSEFRYDKESGTAEATLYSMFKFPESNRVHFQCDILVCPIGQDCEVESCSSSNDRGSDGRSLEVIESSRADALLLQPATDGALMASYSVFVVEPGARVDVESVCSDCSDDDDDWIYFVLSIVFGFLFLFMLIVNIFLCSAMTCSCVRTDTVAVVQPQPPEKDKRIIEEFDPYARSWHGSQYGSRYSLNGGIKPMPVPYIPADNSVSSSEYGMNNGTAVAAVQSRPDSRYSSSNKQDQHQNKIKQQQQQQPKKSRGHRSRSRSNHRGADGGGAHSSSSGQSNSTQYSATSSHGRLVTK